MGLFNKDESRFKSDCVYAKDLLDKHDRIDMIIGKYVLIATHSDGHAEVEVEVTNLNRTINFMATKGWKCNNLCTLGEKMYALMERV